MSKDTPIFAAGKVVGEVRGDTFHKSIRGSRHILRRPRSLALDLQSITDAELAGAVWAEIIDIESGKVYRAQLDTIRRYGTVFNRGFGEQIYLCLPEWGKDAEADQMALFAEAVV